MQPSVVGGYAWGYGGAAQRNPRNMSYARGPIYIKQNSRMLSIKRDDDIECLKHTRVQGVQGVQGIQIMSAQTPTVRTTHVG